MKKIKLLTLLLLFSILSFSNNNEDKFDLIWDRYFDEVNEPKKIQIANEYIKIANNEDNKLEIARGYYLHALLYYNSNKIKAISYLDKVIFYSSNNSDRFFPMAAYDEKARLLSDLGNYEKAIVVLKEGENIAKKNNMEYYYKIRLSVSSIKSEQLGEDLEALEINRECFNALSKIKKKSFFSTNNYIYSISSIADYYRTKKVVDSCDYYIDLGKKEAIKVNDTLHQKIFELNEAGNLVNKKKYLESIKVINSIKDFIYKGYLGEENIKACEYYLGKAYWELNNKDKAIIHFVKFDSLYQSNKVMLPEFSDGYTYLIDYYKGRGDVKNQLKYLTAYNEIEQNFRKKYKKFYKLISEKYELPKIINEKDEKIIFFKIILYVFLFTIIILLAYAVYINIKTKRDKEKFKQIINESLKWQKFPLLLESGEIIEPIKHNIIDVEFTEIKEKKLNQELRSRDYDKEFINEILQKLENFEINKQFLNKSITTASLAKDFNTNPKYLANIINDYKNLKVNDYINNLRIEYAVLILKNDFKIRKYNLEALANEFGFNNVVSFNSAFERATGLKPIFFIKQLEK